MKTLAILTLSVVTIFASAQVDGKKNKKQTEKGTIYRGEKITAEGAITVAEFVEHIKEQEKMLVKLETKILSCCQVKGCWMMVDLGNGQQMRVTFKDYGFFVPMDSEGRTVIMKGIAYTRTTSVDMLRHYAEDAGKSKEEIEAITEPEKALAFEATGLILKQH